MKILAHRGNNIQAPENTMLSLISAYTSGAQVLEFDVQLTLDNQLVVSHDGTINRLTGDTGNDIFIKDQTLKELRWGNYDFGETFNPYRVTGFKYYHTKKRVQIERLQDLLDQLPADVEKLIELKHNSCLTPEMRSTFVGLFAEAILQRGMTKQLVIYSKDKLALRELRQLIPGIRTAVFDWELSVSDQLKLLLEENADGLVTDLDSFLVNEESLTTFGQDLQKICANKKLAVGVILYPFRKPGTITEKEFLNLGKLDFVWSVSTDTMVGTYIDGHINNCSPWLYPCYDWLPLSAFSGSTIDRDWFAFGYAKTNRYCHVYQQDGVKIELKKYDGFLPLPKNPDNVTERLNKLELNLMYVEKNWPFYSGGGLGIVKPLNGDFIATVDYEMTDPMSQAQTLEMAVTNVDPATHRDTPPVTFRDIDAFYDPHGCPPYVGVEHDENDGYRINWNLGADYDNNQYGPPVGDGISPMAGTLRLERRGSYFSAYYKNTVDAPYWICAGVVRNLSMNESVFLRCVAKRWLQEKEEDPTDYHPVKANVFVFKNLHVIKPINNQK